MVKAISPMSPVFSKVSKSSENAGVTIRELSLSGFVNLRVNPADTALNNAVSTTLGHDLPTINKVTAADKHLVVGLSPSEWLVVCDSADAGADMAASLNAGFADAHALVVDVSGGYTQLLVSGKHVIDLLERGTTVDLHPSVFNVGDAYTTLLAKAPVTIIKEKDGMRVICRRSFADHLARWLLDVGEEFGLNLK